MKRLVILILILFALGFTSAEYLESTRVIVGPDSQLVIKGKTNINRFNCVFNASNFKNPIPVYFHMDHGKMVFQETHLILNTRCFDCGNRHMNEDFYDLLHADIYPEVILNLKAVTLNTDHDNTIYADVNIVISGVTNSYKVPLKIEKNNKMIVSGVLDLNIKDFNIEPPRKAMGLIVVSEFIKIDLRLNIFEASL